MSHRGLTAKITTLLEKKHLLSANQIAAELLKIGDSYNKTSIYRAIEKLLSDGEVCQHHFSETEVSYELREHHHDHVVCTSCGAVTIVDCLFEAPPLLAGVAINHHHTTFFGICTNCASKKSKNPKLHQPK